MIAATPLRQEPRAAARRRARQLAGLAQGEALLLADDYEGIARVAREQVEWRRARARRLRRADRAQRRSRADGEARQAALADASSAAHDRLDRGRRDRRPRSSRSPGRAIINSINMENGPRQARPRRAAGEEARRRAVALTIDEDRHGEDARAEARGRQAHLRHRRGEYGLARGLIFDALTFTLATGDAEWIDTAIETIEGIRADQARAAGRASRSSASRTCRFGLAPAARAVLNSVFLHHCVEAGLDLAIVNPAHITPYAEISAERARLADDLVFNRRADALQRFIEHFEEQGRGGERREGRPDRRHDARGSAPLDDPAPQEGRDRGLRSTRWRARRSARSACSTTCCCRR